MPFYEKGDVRIRYEVAGSGFPLLLVPGGGLNSRISNWPNTVFNSFEIFKDEFAEITVFPWKEPAELKQRTINRVRRFLEQNRAG
jgi:hypothetical protein